MKTKSMILLGAVLLLGSVAMTLAAPASASRNYQVVKRDAHSKVMQSIRAVTNGVGGVKSVTNSYTVLGNGMNKQDAGGNWIECVPMIQSFPSGIVCSGANYRVILKQNLNRQGSVDLEMNDGQRIVSHPLAIAYFDPDSGQRRWIASINDCRAQVVSNKVIYANAFTNGGIECSIIYTYGVGAFHQDVVFTKRPAVTPADLGMGSKTRIEIVTELMHSPTPTKKSRVVRGEKNSIVHARMKEPDLVDETLIFNERMRMALGWAFQSDAARTNGQRRIQVAKQLRTMGGNRTVLTETVEWNSVRTELEKLPRRFAGLTSPSSDRETAQSMPARPAADKEAGSFEAQLDRVIKSGSVELAALEPATPQGFVVDYAFLGSSNFSVGIVMG